MALNLLKKLKNIYINTNYGKYVLLTVLVSIFFISIILKLITDREISDSLTLQYTNCAHNIQNQIKILIDNKKEVNFLIALSLSNDSRIIEAFKKNDNRNLNLKEFSLKLSELSPYKNAWFQLIDKKGNSFYRSWTSKCGDNMLDSRLDIKQMILQPKIMTTVSTGKHAMTFKAMVPIYDHKEFIGIFEIITHFNSIYTKLKEEGIESVFIVDKSYKEQITQPYYPLFIDDYYISMDNLNDEILQILQLYGIEKYLSNKHYIMDNTHNYGVITYHIPDIDGKQMGYILAFKKISAFSTQEINKIKKNIMAILIIIVLIVILFGYYFLNKQHEELIIKQHNEHEKEIERNTKFLTIGQMAAGITHEINTPLTYIKGTNEMSKFDIDDMPSSELKTSLLLDNKKIADGGRCPKLLQQLKKTQIFILLL